MRGRPAAPPLGGSNSVPPLFAIHDAILAEDYVGIIENQRCTLECDATVLPLVDPVLFAVPLKSHRYTVCITLIPGKSTGQPYIVSLLCGSAARVQWRPVRRNSARAGVLWTRTAVDPHNPATIPVEESRA